MKNFVFGLGLASLLSMSSCTNDLQDNPVINENGQGDVVLNMSFAGPDFTKAASTAKPTTSWADLKNCDIFFCDPATGEIVATKNIGKDQLDNSGTISAPKKVMIKDLKVGTYDVYAFANSSDAAMIPTPLKNGDAPLWSFGDVRGRNIDDVFMTLKAGAKETVGTVDQQLYNKAVNLFSYKSANVEVTNAGVTQVSLPLERNMALLRIRINKNGYQTSFTDASSFVKVMNSPLSISSLGSKLNSHVANSVIKETAAFKTQNPTVGYDGGTIIDAQNTEWIDVLVPAASRGNATTGFMRTYVVLKGKKGAEERFYGFYLPLLPDNSWTYTKPNAIYDISVKLTSDGETVEPPTPAVVGNVDLNFTLVPWGAVESYEMEI